MTLSKEQVDARIRQELLKPPGPLHRYYMSFADPSKPKGQRWLGGCFIECYMPIDATDTTIAVWTSHTARQYGCNPGGEAYTFDASDMHVPASHMYRLLTRAELEDIGPVESMT